MDHAADCRAAEAILRGRSDRHPASWALDILSSCARRRSVVPDLWRDLPSDRAHLRVVFRMSRELRDRRIFDAATSIATDSERTPWQRIVALGALGAYVDPGLSIDPRRDPEPLTGFGPVRFDNVWGSVDFVCPVDGEVPVADVQAEVIAVVEAVAQSEPDPLVRAAAWWLRPVVVEGTSRPAICEPDSGRPSS